MTTSRGGAVMEVTPNLDIGGAQETVRTLAKYLPRCGHPTVVCTFSDGPLRADIERLGVPVVVLPDRRHSVVALPLFVIEMIRLQNTLTRLVRHHHIDIVQTQGLGTLDFLVMTLRARCRTQVWWTIQNASFLLSEEKIDRHRWLLGAKRRAHRWLYRLGARLVDGVIAVSDETAASFVREIGVADDRVAVVCNAVDIERYPAPVDRAQIRRGLGVTDDEHLMTMVGTFKRQKGHAHLVDAMSVIAARHPDVTLLFVGDGDLLDETRTLVASAGLGSRIRFLGTRRDVAEILAASDSFVLPSLWEGLPVALVEAMASELPVVATEVSGTRQVMIDGVTGWVVPPGDATALADAISELVSDPRRAREMARAARSRAVAFSALGQAEQLASLFRAAAISQPADGRLTSIPRGAR